MYAQQLLRSSLEFYTKARCYTSTGKLKPIVLAYHGITKNPVTTRLGYGLHIMDKVFESQCKGIQSFFNTQHIGEIVDTENGYPSIILTFDDIYYNVFAIGLPILEKYQLKFTIFVTTDFVDQSLFWWDKLRFAFLAYPLSSLDVDGHLYDLSSVSARENSMFELESKLVGMLPDRRRLIIDAIYDEQRVNSIFGKVLESFKPISMAALKQLYDHPLCQIGIHGATHISLIHLTPEQLKQEMQKQVDWYYEAFASEPKQICFPFGEANQAVDDACTAVGLRYGYELDPYHPSSLALKPSKYQRVNRYVVHQHDTIWSLLGKSYGVYDRLLARFGADWL